MPFFLNIAALVQSLFKSRRQLALENLALRQQLVMLKPSVKRPQVSPADRLFWFLFSKYVEGWRSMLHALHPDTVVRWHRQGFRYYWRWKSRSPKSGRPPVDTEIRKLIRQMQSANIDWGAPRIHGELLKLGLEASQATVSKYMVRQRKPPSQTWRTFLENHVIVINERHLRRILREYFDYYHTCRTHMSLNKDPPETRLVEPPVLGSVAFPRVGGLHHRYGRMAA